MPGDADSVLLSESAATSSDAPRVTTAGRPFDEATRHRAMRLSVVEGLFFSFVVGSAEVFFVADAVRLGADRLQQALVVTLPLFMAGMGPLCALALVRRLGRRKPLVVAGASAQATVLAALSVANGTSVLTPSWLIAAVCLYQIVGQFSGTAWSAWFGDVVPAEVRGRYFGRRMRWVQIGTCATLVLAGLLLHGTEPDSAGRVAAGTGGHGFMWLFGLAALSRTVSTILLAASPEPSVPTPVEPRTLPRAGFPEAALRGSEAAAVRRMLLVGFLVQLAVYTASPYFGPFMLKELHFSYLEFMASGVVVMLAKIASLPSWGRVLDTANPRAVFLLSVFMVALIPLPWLLASPTGALLWVVIGQTVSGFAWGGYELTQLGIVLHTASPARRQAVFAWQTILNGWAQLIGSLAAAAVMFFAGVGYLSIFAVSFVLRLAVGMAAPRLLAHVHLEGQGRRQLILRVIGFRSAGGLDHRPVSDDEATPRDPRAA